MDKAAPLPPITLLIEWENAIDVADDWTRKAMDGLSRELRSVADRMPQKPRIMYLYNRNAVPAGTVEKVIDSEAPELRQLADLEIVPTDDLTYYKLKNYGIARTRTPLAVMVDSDAIPQPGWLDALLEPFAKPEVMAVGGFTRLGHEDFLSRAMALTWIFDLEGDREKTEKRNSIHVNNCAVRTDFFRAHPFPDLQAFKKQCVFWLRGVKKEMGSSVYVRTANAKAVHAPHPGLRFLAWRAWTAGYDSDFVTNHTRTKSHLGRFGYAFVHFAKKMVRAGKRIIVRGDTVGMPWYERPFALLVALGYFTVLLAGQIVSSLSRNFDPLPPFRPMEPLAA